MQEPRIRTIDVDAVLQSWKLRVGIVIMLCTPVVAATGAYVNLKVEMRDTLSRVENKVDEKYVSKDAFKDLKDDVRDTKEDVKDIKRFLMNRSGK